MDEMRQLIESVKSELTGEISLFKEKVDSEFKRVNDRVDSGFTRVDERLRFIMIEQARTRADIANMVTRAELQAHTNLILSRIDAFAGKWEDNNYRLAKHGEQLADHAKRLSQIETKLS